MRPEAVNTLSECISLAIIIWCIFRFREYQIEKFRYKVFVLRDSLFDYAADGNISFEHPGYTLMRRTMNGHVRYAHRLSLVEVAYMIFMQQKQLAINVTMYLHLYSEATKDLSPEVLARIEEYNGELRKIVLSQLMLGGIGRLLTSAVVIFWLLLVGIVQKHRIARAQIQDEYETQAAVGLNKMAFEFTK